MQHREPKANMLLENWKLNSRMSIQCWLDVLCINTIMSYCPIFFISDYFQCVRNVHDHNTRQNYGLHASHMKIDLGQACIGYRGPVIWNKILGLQINQDTHEVSFKKALKQCIHNGLFWGCWVYSNVNILIVLYIMLEIWRAKTYNSLTTGISYRWLGAGLQCLHC